MKQKIFCYSSLVCMMHNGSRDDTAGETVSDSFPFHLGDASIGSGPSFGSGPNLDSYSSLTPVLTDEDPVFVKPDKKYECPVCIKNGCRRRLLREAVQTPCGHRLCRQCVDIYMGSEVSKRCPVNEEDCEEITRNNIVPDPGFRKEMKQILVYCRYQTNGCREKVKYSLYEDHLTKCEYREVQCTYLSRGCTEFIQFQNMKEHLQNCGHRPVICEQCGMEFNFDFKMNHERQICPEVTVECPFSCGGMNLKRKQLEDHKANCPRKPEACKYKTLGCTFMGDKDLVMKHEQDIGSHFQVLLESFTEFKIQSQRMQTKLEEQWRLIEEVKREQQRLDKSIKISHSEIKLKMMQQVERLIIAEQAVAAQEHKSASLSQDFQHALHSIEQLKTLIPQLASHDSQIANNELRLAEMDLRFQMVETASYDGILLWKIRDFSTRRKDAETGRTVSLYSQPFYSSRFGYKMCGRVYLNGDGIGRGTHMSLYFVVMKGEYDALLPWPFQCKVSLVLLDQSSARRHLKDEFLPDPTSTSFKRPANAEMNIASGCPLFVAHSILQNSSNSYIKDDTIFIKIQIDASNLQPV